MDSSRRALLYYHIFTTGLLFTAGEEAVRLQELEGNTVTIHTGLTGVQSDAQILWFFQPNNADIKIVNSLVSYGETITQYYTDRFKDRLQLNRSSGSVTIRNISREDSGVYTLQIITGRSSEWNFSLNVYGMVPSPHITRNLVHDPSASGSRCSVLCSVDHQKEMNLSWFKGKELLSQVSDHSSKLTLPLEVNNEEQDIYRCVAANPVSNLSTKLNIIEICSHEAGDFQFNFQVECVIRMVISALVTVALIVLLIEHFKTLKGRDTLTHKL
ncbi:CD48 antigen-like [Salminus brasiliensis]|uniref:CD48 antigen-like n=1 Tax=Salminus brasiliensis TaxID=930266 RepID=UPI003B8392B1